MKQALFLALLMALPAGAQESESTEPTESEESQEIATLLEKVGDAYGGAEELLEFPGFRFRGRILSVTDGVNGKLQLSLSLEGAMRVEISYPTRNEVRVLSGKLAWNGGQSRQKASTAAMALSMQIQYHRIAAPFELAAGGAEDFRSAGVSEEGWAQIRRDWNEKLSMTYGIDTETGLIHRVRGVVQSDDGEIEFISEAWDFREVNGILFPFRMTTIVSGQVAAETILDRVTIVEDFSPGLFLPAGSQRDM